MALQTPYLDAIQIIPGDTPGDKFRWIANLIKERLSECNNLEDVVESEKVPRMLAPLIQVQAAIMLNKKDPSDQNAYSAIAEALKSDDEIVVSRALQASSFFDGSNKTITNVRYFFDNLFPHVSLNTRTRIIKNLTIHLAPKNPGLAEEFFTAVASFYGLEQALPLLLACSETFTYDTIVEKKIVLSRRFIKQIFRKNPNFVVRYLRLSKPNMDPCARNLHPVDIFDLSDFLPLLIKKRLNLFVELYEMHENLKPNVRLSNKCAEAFLKNGKEHLMRKPKLYINLVPLKMISQNHLESIFPRLFPETPENVSIPKMLNYLSYYQQEKKVDLLLKSYQQVYGKSILDNPDLITADLLVLLPSEERVKQVRIKLENEDKPRSKIDYLNNWTCYLPIEESIPKFKEEIGRTSEMEIRSAIACKMIYSCKVNNDEQALLDVLTYLNNRHKNEQAWFLLNVFNALLKLYDLFQLNDACWTVLLQMIMRLYVKKDLMPGNSASVKIVEEAIHHKILQNQSFDKTIDILVDLMSMRCTEHWNILQKYPEHEKICLEACVKVVSEKYDSDKTPWKEDKVGILYDLCASIYYFNECHQVEIKNNHLERMTIKNYPWLMQAVDEILSTSHEHKQRNVYIVQNLLGILKTHEEDLYKRYRPETSKADDVVAGVAIAKLKGNPKDVLVNWKEYLEACQKTWYNSYAKRFVKATRWYKDIPLRFVEQCFEDLIQKKEEDCLDILAVLVYGFTFEKIITPLLPANAKIDVHDEEAGVNYGLIYHTINGMKIANPPVSLTILGKLCDDEYLSAALTALTNVCRRTNAMDVIVFARTLTTQRVSVRKHGIRLMYMVAPRQELLKFLRAQWETEKHHSIREILFVKTMQLFQQEPGPDNWSLLAHVISTLAPNDVVDFKKALSFLAMTPDEYVADFMKLALNAIDNFEKVGVDQDVVNVYISEMLSKAGAAICNLLPEDFIRELIRRFLFHQESEVSRCAGMFVITALLHPAKEKFDKRMRMFSDVFTEVVKNGWNVPHPKYLRFYPVNNAVHRFIELFVESFSYLDIMELRLIDGILSVFLSVLEPQMDAKSYLLLIYVKEQAIVKTPKEFGIKIGEMIPKLFEIFTPLFTFFIIDTLQHFLEMSTFPEDQNLKIIEGLVEVGSIEAIVTAVKLLSVQPIQFEEKYNNLITRFSEHDHPVIRSIVCDINNRTRLPVSPK
ncbi:uncharacterized protein LOC108624705 [Ceratina calcarata]|uniref:Uncharacterized protein LOC108624705 n=1 Tax=Ceratina calcarata TaxID=156304 RepID=A0AAJ7IYH3_9HYME|nr:uncharacterized protein LOC108624705 [Ceratina calcarata]